MKNNAERLLIAGLILVIIGLIAALIVVRSPSRSCDLNNEEKKLDTIISLPEIKNQNFAPCVDDWIWYRGKCYYFSTERDTWNNSEEFCNSHKSSLAIIENKEEKDFLFRFKGLDNHWIGMRRTDDNMAWTWTNGESYNEKLFRITRRSENSGNVEYVFLDRANVRSQDGIIRQKWICSKM
ncbi:C-type lectin domain family 2 member A-like isoform X2 [Phyllobates terribilis]